MVEDESVDPPLEPCLRSISDAFRGESAWKEVEVFVDRWSADAAVGNDIESLVDALFVSRVLDGDRESYDDPKNNFLDHCVTQGRGLPISLCLIGHLTASKRAIATGLVGLPGHVVLSAESQDGDRLFFDPFNHGRRLSRAECLTIAAMSGQNVSEQILEPMASRSVIHRILNNLAKSLGKSGDLSSVSTCAAFRLAMPEIARLDSASTKAMVRGLN